MKAVVLLAGKGRRIQEVCQGTHKALLTLNGKPLLSYWLDNFRKSKLTTIIPVLGYKDKEVLQCMQLYGNDLQILPVWNRDFEITNNAFSLLKADQYLDDEEFIQINGDMVFDWRILRKMINASGSAIAVDMNNYVMQLDSPRVKVTNNKIVDLGRHMAISEADGYAVGIYRFSRELWQQYKKSAEKMIKENPLAGFHDPLRSLFSYNSIHPVSTESYLWMDVDEKADIEKAEKLLFRIKGFSNEKV